MSTLGYFDSVILGVVQGVTEFLPISSSAHLAFVQRWLGLQANSPDMFLFDAMSHLATLGSILVVFGSKIRRFTANLFRDLAPGYTGRRWALRIAALGVAASIPTAAIGLFFKNELEAAFGRPRMIGVELVITGLMLAAAGLLRRGRRGIDRFYWWQAGLVGLAQGIAILPGISRSGATIATAEFFGLRRRWATEFSFLIAFPAILGACALKFREIVEGPASLGGSIEWPPLIVGAVVAFLLGIMSLRLLIRAVVRARLHIFAGYCIAIGCLVAAGII